MAAELRSKKRSSTGDATTSVNKKVKTAKSADKPTPLKSALKKTSKTETVAEEQPAAPAKEKKSKSTKASKKDVKEDDGDVAITEETAVVNGDKPVKVKRTKMTKPAAGKPTKATKTTTVAATDAPSDDADADSDAGPTTTTSDPTTDLTPDQTAALLAGFSDSASDSETEETGLDISTLPQPPTTKAVQKQIAAAASADPEKTPGVIYIGRIPHGFYEPQMRAYFSQFGEITHLKLARNPKTGKSRHFAFVEFASAAVAGIVVKTMDKYLMFGHILQVRNVPAERVGEGFWKGSGRGKKVMPRNRLEGARLRRGVGRDEWEGRVGREEKKRAEKKRQLKELMGYEFESPAVKTVGSVPVRAAGVVEAVEAEKTVDDGEEAVEAIEATPEGVTTTEKVTGKKRPAAKDAGVVKKSKKFKKAVVA